MSLFLPFFPFLFWFLSFRLSLSFCVSVSLCCHFQCCLSSSDSESTSHWLAEPLKEAAFFMSRHKNTWSRRLLKRHHTSQDSLEREQKEWMCRGGGGGGGEWLRMQRLTIQRVKAAHLFLSLFFLPFISPLSSLWLQTQPSAACLDGAC